MKPNTEKTEITAHTPLPWTLKDAQPNGLTLFAPNGSPVCHMRWTDGLNAKVEQRVKADAEYLVRAANAFPKLVKALEYLLETFKHVESCEDFDLQAHPRKDIHSSIEMIESALALAREGKE